MDFNNFIKQLYNFCIESKYTKVVKYKKMNLTIEKLQKIYTNLWGPHNPSSLSRKTYVGLFLDKFTRKLWILLFQSKNKFFDAFKF